MLYQAEEVKPRVAGSIHGRHGSEVLPVRATSAEKSTTWWPQKLQRLHLNFLLFIKISSSQQPSAGKTLGRRRSRLDERDKAKDKEEEMSGQGVLRDEAGEPRKLLMGESSHSDSKSTLKDYWRTFGIQETPKWHRQPSCHTHIRLPVFWHSSDKRKLLVSYIALLCMDVLREVHSSSLSTSQGDNEVIYNPLQLQRTWRMALPSFASA